MLLMAWSKKRKTFQWPAGYKRGFDKRQSFCHADLQLHATELSFKKNQPEILAQQRKKLSRSAHPIWKAVAHSEGHSCAKIKSFCTQMPCFIKWLHEIAVYWMPNNKWSKNVLLNLKTCHALFLEDMTPKDSCCSQSHCWRSSKCHREETSEAQNH